MVQLHNFFIRQFVIEWSCFSAGTSAAVSSRTRAHHLYWKLLTHVLDKHNVY
jgi:hypothetical protein